MRITMTKEEAAELVKLGLESDDSPIVIKGDITEVEVKVTQNGVTMQIGLATDDDDSE